RFVMQAEQAGAGDIVYCEWFKTAGTGTIKSLGAGTMSWISSGIAAWQPAGTSVVPGRWAASTSVVLNQMVHPVGLASTGVVSGTQNLPLFQCTTAGTTGGTEPTWPAAIGGTVNDNGVV